MFSRPGGLSASLLAITLTQTVACAMEPATATQPAPIATSMEASPACDGGKEHQGVAVGQTCFRMGHAPVHEQDQPRPFSWRQ